MDSIVEMAHTQLGPLLEEIRSWRESTRALNQNLIVVACINIRNRDLIGHQQLHEFLLEMTASDVHKLESLENLIISLEDKLLMDSTPGKDGISDIVKVRKDLIKVKRYYEQMEFLTDALCAVDSSFAYIDKKFDRLLEFTFHLQTYLESVREAYQSQIDIEQNNIMKVFTVVTSIFLPLSLIAAWYGMNFSLPEYQWSYGYPFVVSLSLGLVVGLLIFFRKKKWF